MRILKVLIAEDEELLRDLYEIILEGEFECKFIKVAGGEDAIEELKQHSDIDLIISDFSMPHGNGGRLYTYNKLNQNIPFILISAGELGDYTDFVDFKKNNKLNAFFTKPFLEIQLTAHIRQVLESINEAVPHSNLPDANLVDSEFVKILLTNYAKYTTSSDDVYLKLADKKYTKIVSSNDADVPDAHQISHYLKKGIEFVYVKESCFNRLLKELYSSIQSQMQIEKKAMTLFEIQGTKFQVSLEGLVSIGISDADIASANEVIDQTISSFLNNKESKKCFLKYCEGDGFLAGHSLLIVYIAGKISSSLESQFNFQVTMKKISTASFFHDFSLLETADPFMEMKLSEITDGVLLNKIRNHPIESAKYLPKCEELFEETKKIILEHHELPDGSGYPNNLKASQISIYACLFIISEQIVFCLIRNNFCKDRLKDFLINSEAMYSQGNFSKVYKLAMASFVNNGQFVTKI